MRRDPAWRDRCEAAGVTSRVVVSSDWLGSVVFIKPEDFMRVVWRFLIGLEIFFAAPAALSVIRLRVFQQIA